VSAGAPTLLSDALGSTVAEVNEGHSIAASYTYSPYGEMAVAGAGGPVGFTGRSQDNSGLYNLRARYYNPQTARFISHDPLGLAAGDTNLYRYVANDPLGFVDPLGLAAGRRSFWDISTLSHNEGVEPVSLAKHRPLLDGVFGPLTAVQDECIRSTLAAVDEQLLTLARRFGLGRSGWEGTGLELNLDRAGQLAITSYVETVDSEAHAADFFVGLRPSWSSGDRTGEPAWIVEAWIDVDCQHVIDHEGMETVHDRGDVRATTPESAVEELLRAATELVQLGASHPVEFWTSRAAE
jgi:RHS repeat-associated protein